MVPLYNQFKNIFYSLYKNAYRKPVDNFPILLNNTE